MIVTGVVRSLAKKISFMPILTKFMASQETTINVQSVKKYVQRGSSWKNIMKPVKYLPQNPRNSNAIYVKLNSAVRMRLIAMSKKSTVKSNLGAVSVVKTTAEMMH